MLNFVNITTARKDLYKLVEDANRYHTPMIITGKKGNAVLLAEEDFRDIEETLFLNAIPGMVESILEGGRTPISECEDLDEDW